MASAAANREKSLIGLALVVSAVVLLALTQVVEATRYVPSMTTTAPPLPQLEAHDQVDAAGETFTLFTADDLSLLAALALLDAPVVERVSAEKRFQLLAEPGAIPRPVEVALKRKLASGLPTCGIESNVLKVGGLVENCSGPSFQGTWTDPVTGLAYHRNRWYDPRNASWLSEDPKGDVDSPNFYAFVGWGPHAAVDPMGLASGAAWDAFVADPETQEFYSEIGPVVGANPADRLVGGALGVCDMVVGLCAEISLSFADTPIPITGWESADKPVYVTPGAEERNEARADFISSPVDSVVEAHKMAHDLILHYESIGDRRSASRVAAALYSGDAFALLSLAEGGVALYRFGRSAVSMEFLGPRVQAGMADFSVDMAGGRAVVELRQALANLTDPQIDAMFSQMVVGETLFELPANSGPALQGEGLIAWQLRTGGANIDFHEMITLRGVAGAPAQRIQVRPHSPNRAAPPGSYSSTHGTTQVSTTNNSWYMLPDGTWKQASQMTAADWAAVHLQ